MTSYRYIADGIFEENVPEEEIVSPRDFAIQSIQNGIRILDNDPNWNQLLYKEALNIKRKDLSLDHLRSNGRHSIADVMPMLIITVTKLLFLSVQTSLIMK